MAAECAPVFPILRTLLSFTWQTSRAHRRPYCSPSFRYARLCYVRVIRFSSLARCLLPAVFPARCPRVDVAVATAVAATCIKLLTAADIQSYARRHLSRANIIRPRSPTCPILRSAPRRLYPRLTSARYYQPPLYVSLSFLLPSSLIPSLEPLHVPSDVS